MRGEKEPLKNSNLKQPGNDTAKKKCAKTQTLKGGGGIERAIVNSNFGPKGGRTKFYEKESLEGEK